MKFSELEYSTKVILKVVFVVLALAFIWAIREVIAIFLLAVVLASALDPLADYLHTRKIPRAVSVLAVYVIVFGVVGLVLVTIAPSLVTQFHLLSSNFPEYLAELHARYPSFASILPGSSLGEIVSGVLTGNGGGSVFTRTLGVFNGLLGFVTVLVVSFYLVASQQKGMKELIRSVVPAGQRELTMGLVEKIQKKMGLWVLGQIILSIAIFILTFVGLTLLNVKYALVLALIAGLLEVVPYIGPIVSAVPALFFALIQSPALGIGVIVLYIIIQKTEGYILVPKIMHKTVGVSPLVVILALLTGFKLAGIVGLLLAVPIAAAATVLIDEFSGGSSEPKPTTL